MEFLIYIAIGMAIAVLLVLFINRKPLPNITSDADVIAILKTGDKIKAAKAYRQLHGASLRQARLFLKNHTPNER